MKQPHTHAIAISSDGPAEMLLEEHHDLDGPAPGSPLVCFPSGDMPLSREAELRLTRFARTRYDQLERETGRDQTASVPDTGTPAFLDGVRSPEKNNASRTFMAKRLLYQYIMQDDFSWRPLADPASVFAQSNLSVPLCRRIARQMSARAINYFFGTEPYFSVLPVGEMDKQLAEALQTLANLKIRESGSHNTLRSAIEGAFESGETVLKVTWRDSRSFYRRVMKVAVNSRGKALLALDGLPIEETDLWIPSDPNVPDSPRVLKRDRRTPQPKIPLTFQTLRADQELLHYRGPEIEPLYFRDFMAPLNAVTLQKDDCDCCVHVKNMTASALASAYMQSPGSSLEALRAAIHKIREAVTAPREGRAAANLRPELGEVTAPEMPDATMLIGEFYLRFDADGDGYEEDVMLVMDLDTDTPIYYNYVPNITADGLRPFRVVRAKPVPNRWYGQGAVELFENLQKAVDLLVNRRNRNQSEAGRVTFWNPHQTIEGEADPALKFNWGRTYTLKPGVSPNDVLGVVYLDDNKFDRLTQEIEFNLQLAMNESGVQHANDNFVAGMDTSKLATGIRNVEKTGQELFGVMISNLEPGIETTVDAFVTTLYANLDEDETVTILESEVPRDLTIHTRDVRHLRFNIQVLLTRMRDEQVMESSQRAEQLVTHFYALPMPLQPTLAPFYIDMLKALQVQNPKKYIVSNFFSLTAPAPAPTPAPAAFTTETQRHTEVPTGPPE